MIPVYFIGKEVEREKAWRKMADAAISGEELVALARAVREWHRVVAQFRRPAVNDNSRCPHATSADRTRSPGTSHS